MQKLKEQFITDTKGHKKAVILSIKKYRELLENLHDLAIVAERRDEPTISYKELLTKIKL